MASNGSKSLSYLTPLDVSDNLNPDEILNIPLSTKCLTKITLPTNNNH